MKTITSAKSSFKIGLCLMLAISLPERTWATLFSATYGNGTFVAVGSEFGPIATILTSPDGVTWTSRDAGTDSFLTAVAYGNGTFVAVGSVAPAPGSSLILTSVDGTSWTSRTVAMAERLQGITYGNGIWVAVGGDGGAVVTSPDAITWTVQNSGTQAPLFGVTYGNGLFVAGGFYGVILTSPDGVVWTSQNSGTDAYIYDLTYGDGLFVSVAVGPMVTDEGTILTSSDGISWAKQGTGTTIRLEGIGFGNGTFVAGRDDNIILTSIDGVTWISRSAPASGFNGVAYGNGTFIAVGGTESAGWNIVISKDGGVTWLLAPPAPQVAGSLDPAFAPDVEGSFVLATAVQPDGKIVIGGVFNSVNGQPRGSIARLHADGTVESTATFNPGIGADGQVISVAMQPDGKILLGGYFTTVDGQPRNRIARLNSDGTVESTNTFNPGTGANGGILGVAVQADGKIVIVGGFRSVNEQPRNGIARLHADGTVENTATFNPGTGVAASFEVYTVTVQADGKILLGGYFTSVNGQPRRNIARLHANGTVESTATFNPGTGTSGGIGDFGLVSSVVVQPDGKILLGGSFSSVNGQPRGNIARLHANGTVESMATFNPGTAGGVDSVLSVAVQADGKILLGGAFSIVNGQPNGIARLHADGTLESTATFNPGTGAGGPIPIVYGVAVQADGKILLVGGFRSVDGQPRNLIARLANDAATQTLTIPNRARIQWARGGAAPEVEQVTFELFTDGGANWSLLGPGTRIAGGWERTGLSLPASGSIRARGRTTGGIRNGSSGLVEQIAAFSFAPEIAVEQPLNTDLADGGSQPFGTVDLGANTNLTFTIKNTGTADLTGLGITVDGPDAAMFTVTASPTAPVSGPSGSTTFTVQFAPTSAGGKTAALHIENNDADENPFDLILTGTMLGARGAKENVLAELIALRATVTDQDDGQKLDQAIEHLTRSLDSELWVDQTHLQRKHGEKVFHEEKETVQKLCDLSQSNQSNIPDAVLEGFIDRIFRADRLLASVAIQDAITAGVSSKKIEQAQKHLAKGDAEAGDDECDNGIEDYRNAWKHAVRAKVSPPIHLANGRMQLEILGEPGERFTIQASSNLADWVTIGTGTANAEGVVTFEDADAGQYPVRYYRTVSQ